MAMIAVKVSEELMKKIGATSTADFETKLQAHVTNSEQESTNMATLTERFTTLEAKVVTLESRPAAGGPLTVTDAIVEAILANPKFEAKRTEILGAAKTAGEAAGSSKAAEALGAVGRPPVAGAPVTEPITPAAPQLKTLLEAGKFEEAYALDDQGKKDFADAKSYAAYMRADAKGRVRIVTK